MVASLFYYCLNQNLELSVDLVKFCQRKFSLTSIYGATGNSFRMVLGDVYNLQKKK